MSVHGEYGRALEEVIAAVEWMAPSARAPLQEALVAARLGNQPDLSAAARAALNALEALPVTSDVLSERAEHLGAHCRAILGEPRGPGQVGASGA